MSHSPIRILVELEGVEPNDRLEAALDELEAAAAELVEESSEVTGYLGSAMGSEESTIAGVWTEMRPAIKSWSLGVGRVITLGTTTDGR